MSAPTLKTVLDVCEKLWPKSGAEEWDRVGLTTGDEKAPVRRILLAVDAVRQTVEEAIDSHTDLLITHHPLLLRGVNTVAESTYKGALLASLIRANCAHLAAHTNADVVEEGTSAAIAEALELENIRPIEPSTDNPHRGLGRTGHLHQPVTLGELANQLAAVLPKTAGGIRVAGDAARLVHSVALCGGAGDSMLSHPAVTASDVYITSDLRHHPVSEARETALNRGGAPALIDTSHWASESLWLERAARQLREKLDGVDIEVSTRRTDPWDFVVGVDASRH